MMTLSSRRSLLAAVAGSATLPLLSRAAAARRIRLGGPIFLKSNDPRELAREHRRLGYSAAYCPAVEIADADGIRAIEKAFAAENVVIAEVGAWKNMLDPDPAKRKANLDYVVSRCQLAEAVGAKCCVDIAGSYNPTVWYGPDPRNLSKEFFDATVDNCRHIIDAVRPKRTKFTIEIMPWNLPDGPDSYVELVRAVNRPAFGVHLDVCNAVNSPRHFYNNANLIRDCFQKLGQWIVSCHAKDLEWVPEFNIHFREVVPGRGQIDYATYLKELANLSHDAPLMLEHLKTSQDYEEGKRHIQTVASKTGISFA